MTRRNTRSAGRPSLEQAKAFMRELRAERGRVTQLATALGLSPQAVHKWQVVPLARVIDVERATGISRRKLRPDHHDVPSAATR